MSEGYSESEQLDMLKSWWKKNGNSLLIGILVALAIFFGWRAWQNHHQQQAYTASALFDQLIELTVSQTALDQAARLQVNTLVNQLNENYSNTLYAQLARLIQARVALDNHDDATALASLQQLAEKSSDPFIKGLAQLDIARLQINAKQFNKALTTLQVKLPEVFAAQQADIRGDAYVGLQQFSQARDAYRQAIQLAKQNQQSLLGVELKLADLSSQENQQ